jgi:hypothetical protein
LSLSLKKGVVFSYAFFYDIGLFSLVLIFQMRILKVPNRGINTFNYYMGVSKVIRLVCSFIKNILVFII